MSKYAIFGAGAMGSILGAYIAKGGVEIDLISRNREHISEMKENGVKIIGKDNFTQKVNALYLEEMKERYDVIFLMTKQSENKKTAEFLKDYLSETGVVCTMQNGLPEIVLREVLGDSRVYSCAVAWGATFHGKGVSELTSEKRSFALGALSKNRDRLNEIKEILSNMGEVEIEEDILGARMAKLTINCAFSGLSTVTGESFGYVYSNGKCNKVALRIMGECMEVAKAMNVKKMPVQGRDMLKLFKTGGAFRNFVSSITLKIAMRHHKDLYSGMLKDIQKGRKCDVDYINGIICSLAKNYGVDAKYNKKVVEIVHGIENGFFELTKENILFFEELK